jgi:hypothetical protein
VFFQYVLYIYIKPFYLKHWQYNAMIKIVIFPIMIFPPFCCSMILIFFSVLCHEMSSIYGCHTLDVTHSVWPSFVPIQTTKNLCFHVFESTERRLEDKLINHKINKLWLVAGCLECIHMPILYTHCLCCGLIYLVTMTWSRHTSEMKRTWPCSNIWSHQQTVKHLKTTALPIH